MIVGLDLSLTCTGMVAIPLDFARDVSWSACHWTTAGQGLSRDATEQQRIARMRDIADAVTAFCREHATSVWLEEQAFRQSGAMARELAGMTWTVRMALADAGFKVNLVHATAARKRFLGHSRRGAKTDLRLAVIGLDAPFDGPDLCDAWAVANYGLAEQGYPCVTVREAA